MELEEIWHQRQNRGYSMDMMAEYLHISLDSYIELEFQLREATKEEQEILRKLWQEN